MTKNSCSSGIGNSSRRRIATGTGAAFTATAVFAGGAYATGQLTSPPKGEPDTIQVFGAQAKWAPLNPAVTNWNDMLQRQQGYMNNPKDAQKYRAFLKKFDQYRGQPLEEMAAHVNALVQSKVRGIEHLDFLQWDAPFQTATSRKGDCKAYAALQYSILRYLGVPEDRLFMALVNDGHYPAVPDHVVLLLNTAPAGKKQNFVVLNADGPVVNANDYEQANSPAVKAGWSRPYSLYAVLNQDGLWINPQDYLWAVSPIAAAAKIFTKQFGPPAPPPSVSDQMTSQVRNEINNDTGWNFLSAYRPSRLSLETFNKAALTGTFKDTSGSSKYTVIAKCQKVHPAKNRNPSRVKCAIYSASGVINGSPVTWYDPSASLPAPPGFTPPAASVRDQVILQATSQIKTIYKDAFPSFSVAAFNRAALTATVSAYSSSDFNEEYYFSVQCQKVQPRRNGNPPQVKCSIISPTTKWVGYDHNW